MGKSLVVTTGATATFRPLIEAALSAEFLDAVLEMGFDRVVVQYGTEVPVSRQVYDECVLRLSGLGHIGVDVGTARLESHHLLVEGIAYDSQFVDKYVQKADLVVSHGGTGSILDALRLEKKLVVVINDSLMDNHQLEIAEEFARMGVLVYAAHIDELVGLVRHVQSVEMKRLGPSKGAIVERVICDEVM